MTRETTYFLNWKATHVKARTVYDYRPWLDLFTAHTQNRGLETVTLEEIVTFSTKLREKYSSASIAYGMGVIHALFVFYEGKIPLCVSHKDIRVPKSYSKSHEPITADEYVLLLSHIDVLAENGLRNTCLLRLLWDTGARISEIANLKPEMLDMVNCGAYIPNAKRNDEGWIFWSKDTNEFIKAYLRTTHGNPFPSTRQCQREIQKYVNLSGIGKKITAHSFRHAKAHRIIDASGSVKHVQGVLRHLSPISSFKYLQLNLKEMKKMTSQYLDDDTPELSGDQMKAVRYTSYRGVWHQKQPESTLSP